MPDRRWSDADRELVADAIYAPLPGDPTPRPEFNRTGARLHNKAGRVLDALAAAGKLADPDHDARVRADERARVAEEIATYFDGWAAAAGAVHADAMVDAWHEAARLARAHATTPTTEEDPNATT